MRILNGANIKTIRFGVLGLDSIKPKPNIICNQFYRNISSTVQK